MAPDLLPEWAQVVSMAGSLLFAAIFTGFLLCRHFFPNHTKAITAFWVGGFLFGFLVTSFYYWPKKIETYTQFFVSGGGGITVEDYSNTSLILIPHFLPNVAVRKEDSDYIDFKLMDDTVYIQRKGSPFIEDENPESITHLMVITFDKPSPNQIATVTPVSDVEWSLLESGGNYAVMKLSFQKRRQSYKIEFK